MTATVPPRARPVPTRRPQVLRCPACHRTELRVPESTLRLTPGAWPMCCGQPMVAAATVADRGTDDDVDTIHWDDRRGGDRRPARAGTRLEVCLDGPGPGADVAIALLDVSATGVKVAIRGPVPTGDRVLLSLGPPDGGWEYIGPGLVCWCVPGAEGTALAGVRLDQPLTDSQMGDLAD